MIVDINYQVILRNNNRLKGKVKAKIGEQIQAVRQRVLASEGLKNKESFVLSGCDWQQVSGGERMQIKEKGQRQSNKSTKSAKRKGSEDSSIMQVSSIDYDDQAKQFMAVQPQKPPIVRGTVQKCNSFLCCFSSTLHLELDITELNIYPDSSYKHIQDTISINDIKQIRSYRKKDFFFIQMVLLQNLIDLKFTNRNLCKEWMGYLMQAMSFNKYLNQKRIFSKADSFTNFMTSLRDQTTAEVVNLEAHQNLKTIYEELPEEKTVMRMSKKFIKLSEFQVKYNVGKGSFSIIYLVKRGKRLFGLKQLSKQKLLIKNQLKYALTQLKALIKCRACKYVIPLYYAFQTPDYLYLALEYVDTGDLSTYIKMNGIFSPQAALIVLTELVFTIEFIHRQKLIYRDLKPENILIDGKGHIYLIDFGLAKELDNEDDYAESFLGTPLYLAPERFQGGGSINFKSDIYGVGCIFYQMLHGQSPFHATSYHSLVERIRNDTPQINKQLPEDIKLFLLQTLEKDPARRISTMSKHRLFRNTNWKQIAQKSHKGIKIGEKRNSSIQIDYSIDKDYDQYTFPLRLVEGWEFNYETQR